MASGIQVKEALLFELLNELESDSAESEDEELLAAIRHKRIPTPKILDYVDNVVHRYSDEEFRRNFRLNRNVCYDLINDFGKSAYFPHNEGNGGRPQKTPEEDVLSFLWFAGNKACMRDVAGRFNLSESSLFRMIDRVTGFLDSIAAAQIHFPNKQSAKRAAAEDFEVMTGFPGVLGCIDGTHIPVRCRVGKIRSTYVNRHDQTSILLQGICNAHKKFIDVCTGPPGKSNDSRLLKLSFIYPQLPELCIGGYHILGDGAYQVREHLMTPYRDYGNLSERQTSFNAKLCGTRVCIENTFGILKQRFRQLKSLELWTVEKMANVVMSCCVLHNLCMDNGDSDIDHSDEEEEEEEEESEVEEDSSSTAAQIESNRDALLRQLGEDKRDRLCRLLT